MGFHLDQLLLDLVNKGLILDGHGDRPLTIAPANRAFVRARHKARVLRADIHLRLRFDAALQLETFGAPGPMRTMHIRLTLVRQRVLVLGLPSRRFRFVLETTSSFGQVAGLFAIGFLAEGFFESILRFFVLFRTHVTGLRLFGAAFRAIFTVCSALLSILGRFITFAIEMHISGDFVYVESITQLRLVDRVAILFIVVAVLRVIELLHLVFKVVKLVKKLLGFVLILLLQAGEFLLHVFLMGAVDGLKGVEVVLEFLEGGAVDFFAHFLSEVVLGRVLLESSLQLKKLLIVEEVFILLGPIRGDHFLVVAEDLVVKFNRQCLFKVIFGHQAAQ